MKARLSSLISRANIDRCGSRHYPVLSMTMHDGLVLQSERFKKEIASRDRSQYKVVQKGQLVVGFPIDEGVLAAQEVTDRGIVSPAYDIWDIEQSLILPKYLELSLRSERAIEYYKAKLKGTTARRRSIRKDDFLSMTINVPAISQQYFILNRIKAIDGLLAKCESQSDNLDELVKSRFIEMFGDPVLNSFNFPKLPWEKLLTIRNGKNQSAVEQADGPYPICGSGGEIGRATSYITSKNSVIIGRKGNINNPILMREPFWNVDTAFGLEPDERHVTVEYLYEYCQFFDFRKLNKAVTIPSLTKADLLKIRMPTPPIDAQLSFSRFRKQVDKLRFDVQQQIEKLETLKKSLMQEYFG